MRLIAGAVVSLAGAVGLPTETLAQAGTGQGPGPGGPWHMMHDWGWGWGGMFLGPLVMLVWLAILVAVVVLVVRWLGGGTVGLSPSPRTPRDILDERFARGEIDQEEYEKRRKALSS